MTPLRRLHREETAISVVELLVVMLIFGVVGVGLATSAISLTRSTHKVDAMTTDQNSGRNAMALLSRDIRAAAPVRRTEVPAFLDARTHRVEFTALLGSSTQPQLVQLFIDDQDQLVEQVVPSNGGTLEAGTLSYDVDQAVIRHITTFVVNRPDEWIFTYHAGDEDLEPTDGSALSAADRARITGVTIRLRLSSDPTGRTGTYVIENRVRLPNVQYGLQEAT